MSSPWAPGEDFVSRISTFRPLLRISETSSLSSAQVQIASLELGFSHEACNLRSLTAMMVGSLAFKVSRLAFTESFSALGWMRNSIAVSTSRAMAWTSALACEVTAFRGVNQLLSPVTMSPEQSFLNPQSWLASCTDFFVLKTLGHWGGGNVALSHLAQDAAVVLGHKAGFALGLVEESKESLSQQLLHAEAMNWQLGIGTRMMSALSGHAVNFMERNLERANAVRNIENSQSLSRARFEGLTRMANHEEGLKSDLRRMIPRSTKGNSGVHHLMVGAALLIESVSESGVAIRLAHEAIRAIEFVRGSRFRSIESVMESLSNSKEDIRRRELLKLFKNESVRIEEISANSRRTLRRAWGFIPASYINFLRRNPEASHLKIWRFHGAQKLLSDEAESARYLYKTADIITEIRLGFNEKSLYSDNHFDVLPDEFYVDAVAHEFPENPFRPAFVTREINGKVVREMRRNHAYPVYDGVDSIDVHKRKATAAEARAHDWGHILILSGYSRAYVDDLMTFYDALQTYKTNKGMPLHDEMDADIYEGSLDIFMYYKGREHYSMTLERLRTLYGGFVLMNVGAYLVSIRRPNTPPNFNNDYQKVLFDEYVTPDHPRRDIILAAWRKK